MSTFDRANEIKRLGGIADICDHDMRALPREFGGERLPIANGRTCNNYYLTLV